MRRPKHSLDGTIARRAHMMIMINILVSIDSMIYVHTLCVLLGVVAFRLDASACSCCIGGG